MKYRTLLILALVIAAMLIAWGYRQATRDPVVRETRISLAGWPAGQAPVRAVLMSDLHVAGPDMPPERLARIVAQVNALAPDIVLIAGDLVSDKFFATRHYDVDAAVAPLKGLRAPLGTLAVLGNHDHWRDTAAFRRAVPATGVTLLTNQAVQRGPLVIGGIDDEITRHADVARAVRAMDALSGPRLVLSHSPDIVPLLPARIALVLAGHTHCGQISLPLIGRISTASRYGERFACGRIEEAGRTIMVTAGLGTSVVPLRYGVPPDLWVVTLGP
jgi:predicted MPP superfamily phosphohydrolase